MWVFLIFFLCVFVLLLFAVQMGGASSYNTQFMPHPGPRGPPGMASSGMVSSRPPSMGAMYGSQGQRMPQHSGYPGGQQGPPPRHQQGLKRPYNSEVSKKRHLFFFFYCIFFSFFFFFFSFSITFSYSGVFKTSSERIGNLHTIMHFN